MTVNAVWRRFSVSMDSAERCRTLADETHFETLAVAPIRRGVLPVMGAARKFAQAGMPPPPTSKTSPPKQVSAAC